LKYTAEHNNIEIEIAASLPNVGNWCLPFYKGVATRILTSAALTSLIHRIFAVALSLCFRAAMEGHLVRLRGLRGGHCHAFVG